MSVSCSRISNYRYIIYAKDENARYAREIQDIMQQSFKSNKNKNTPSFYIIQMLFEMGILLLAMKLFDNTMNYEI